jgi:quinol-cytochrome oxidoreductase complex cytochrome b subunit
MQPEPAFHQKVPLAELASREWVAGLVAGNIILALSLWLPPALGYSPDAPASGAAYAPWVFGPVQVLLRWMSPLLGGVLAPVLAVLSLLSLPYLARKQAWRLATFLFWAFYLSTIVLTVYFLIGR